MNRLVQKRLAPAVVVLAAAYASGDNLIRNPSFEQYTKDGPVAWSWIPGRAGAQLRVDTTRARTGKASVLLINRTPRAPHVYSQLTQTVAVRSGHTYTLSCYVWTEGAGAVWIGGGRKWQFRFPFPQKTDGWQRVTGTFKADANTFTVRILTESPTRGVWVDDVQLEPGDAATPFAYVPPPAPGECRVVIEPYEPAPNLVPNPSFEIVDGVRPRYWMWDRRNTDATMTVDDQDAHSGKYSVRFTNGTPFAPQVYGWFGLVGGLEVEPETVYTLSAYVKSENPGIAWIGGGKNWRIRCHIPATENEWTRIQTTFTTLADERTFPLMIVTESPTRGFRVDDVRLEKGPRATPFISEAERDKPRLEVTLPPPRIVSWRGRTVRAAWAAGRYPPDEFLFTAGPIQFRGEAWLPRPPDDAVVRVRLLDSNGAVVLEKQTQTSLKRHGLAVNVHANIGDVTAANLTAEVALIAGGKTAVKGRRSFKVVTAGLVQERLASVRRQRDELAPLVQELERRGVGAYSRVVLTVLDNFIPWIEEDLDHETVDRAWDQAVILDETAAREIEKAREILAGKRPGMVTPRYRTGPIRIQGPSFIATRAYPDGRTEQGPVFFVGYGHFAQVRRDVEKFPGYGCNLIQIEFGPRSVLPAEATTSDAAVRQFLDVCNRAAKANVAVNLLLSPHYFPQWALEKWPWLRECHGGFFKYCVHAAESRSVLEKSLRFVIPRIQGHPALHSLCLSNEPICTDLTGCRVSKKTWPEWLRKRYGGRIDNLNAAWETRYRRFEEIPIPPPKFTPGPDIYDFVLFNQETFADFHEWMADVIHSMAPDAPVHAKIMMSAHFSRSLHGVWSVSPELFAYLSRINGNDCCCWYRRQGEFASAGPEEAMAYDFQRSMADLPVFNSENHIIVDRDHDVIPPAHVFTTLWQGSVHGQSATTIWVWERTYDPASSLAGSILHRPDCVVAAGRACLDLNRLADQVTALQRLRPQVVFFWSLASVVQGENHARHLTKVYRAADFLGAPLGFVTERQLERYAGGNSILPLADARVIVVVETTHVPDFALAGLQRFANGGGRVVTIGSCFGKDEYGRTRRTGVKIGTPLDVSPEDERAVFAEFAKRLAGWGVKPEVTVTDEKDVPVFGVEYRCTRYKGRLLVNVCNYLRSSQTVRLHAMGKPLTRMWDEIGAKPVFAPLRLDPLQPMLLRIEE